MIKVPRSRNLVKNSLKYENYFHDAFTAVCRSFSALREHQATRHIRVSQRTLCPFKALSIYARHYITTRVWHFLQMNIKIYIIRLLKTSFAFFSLERINQVH